MKHSSDELENNHYTYYTKIETESWTKKAIRYPAFSDTCTYPDNSNKIFYT